MNGKGSNGTATASPAGNGGEPQRFSGLRVGVVGLGIEGQDVVRFLAAEGAAAIVVTDQKPRARLAPAIESLAGVAFELVADGNDPAIAERVDALFVSQGVPDSAPLVQAARRRGLPVTAMMRHFLQRCPAPVIGITGSAGKTTTTALVGAMFRAAQRPVFVGGNIGTGLLSALPSIAPTTTVVLEISHTQLVRTDRSPHLAAVLNLTPNHLDQFTWDEYVELKRNLVRYQQPGDLVVLPADDPVAAGFEADTPARSIWFGPTAGARPSARVRNGRIAWDDGVAIADVLPVAQIPLPGEHNLRNVLAAVAIGGASGLPPAAMAAAIRAFEGVPHRLESVAEAGGIRYINDSIATTPERAVAALRAVRGPVILLLGGRDKRLPFETLAAEARTRVRAVVTFGEAAGLFATHLADAWATLADTPPVVTQATLEAAFAEACRRARPGDAVLLSPAGTSFDAYDNSALRGEHFRNLVRRATDGADTVGADTVGADTSPPTDKGGPHGAH